MHIFNPSSDYYQLESDRLNFRTLTIEDVAAWTPFFDRDDYQRFLGQDTSISGADRAKMWIERQIERKNEKTYGQLAIIEKSTGNFIGIGGIIQRELNDRDELEITYSLLPSAWGKGYARELAKRFMDYSETKIGVKSVISMIHPENEASKKVAFANGLKLDGTSTFMSIPVEVYRIDF